jgi:DNA-binding response OmpR family regulator
MPTSIAVVSGDPATAERLTPLIAADTFEVTTCTPDALPADLPDLFVVALPGLETPEEQLIETLRADDTTAQIPIVIVSALPMIELQSVPYASDWTIAIVEEPVDPQILTATMTFLLNPQ